MKLFFTDLDGTLLTDEKIVSEKTKQTLKKWSLTGHKLILNSGRPLDSILEVKRLCELNFSGMYIVANNGGCIYDCDNEKILQRFTIPYEYVTHIEQEAKKLGIHCQTYSDTHIICEKENEHLLYYTNRIHMPCIFTEDMVSVLPAPPQKMVAIHIYDHQKLEDFKLHLSSFAKDKLELVYSSNELLEIIPYNSGKGNSIRTICELLNVPIENSLAAGDMNNDISMIKASGIGIAMKNATPALKEIADIITVNDNNHDGLVPILEKYI